MPTKTEKLQSVWHKYDAERSHKPTSAREAVEWAVREGLLQLPEVDPYDVLAGQMSQALREEYADDGQGRRYRVNHAVRVSQRREQIIGDNVQLKTDVDVYNDFNRGKQPQIQLVLDYTDDVAEREVMRKIQPQKAVA